MNHTEVLNQLAEKFGYKTYLEIGVQNPENNFNKIICPSKTGVDPDMHTGAEYDGHFFYMPSNEFFRKNKNSYDLIFIDGLHEWEQVFIDFINAMNVINHHGSIVLHDCLPENKAMQEVPRQTKEWTGDTWKAVSLAIKYSFLFEKFYVIESDYGIGIFQNLLIKPGCVILDFDKDFKEYRKYCHITNHTLI